MIDRIHHIAVVVKSVDAAFGFFRDVMGLQVTADRVIEDQGVRAALLAVGENEIELIEPVRADTGVARYLATKGETLHHVCFRTDDIEAELARLKAAGVELIDQTPREGLAGRVAFIHPRAMHGVLVELAQPPAGAHDSHDKGFDHLAAMVADYPAAREAWRRALGLEVVREIPMPARQSVIAQVPAGQCMVELISGTSPDSPMVQRIAERGEGMSSGVAIEVSDIDAQIAHYRAAGYTLPDAETGPLPNSVTSTIPGDQTFGLNIQLIQYGRTSERRALRSARLAMDSREATVTSERPIRVLIAKPGLDGHDRGAKVVARALRDAGMEVIYTGIRQAPQMIAEAAMQEDVQVVGLSILSGAHLELFPRVLEELHSRGVDDVLLFAGGIIPEVDVPQVKEMGFAAVFGPGTDTAAIIEFVREHAPRRA